MELFDASKAAELIGCAAYTVRRLADEHAIGKRVGRVWVFEAREVEKLRGIVKAPGNPTMLGGTEAQRTKLAKRAARVKKAKAAKRTRTRKGKV